MSLEEAIKELDFAPSTDISNAASKTTDVVKVYINAVKDNHVMDETNIAKENKILQALYKRFFDHADAWSINTRQKNQDVEDHSTAGRLKTAARDAISDVQKNIVRFAVIYMHIGRCIGFVSEEIQSYESKAGAQQNFQWTSDTGEVLKRYQKERLELIDSNAKLERGIEIISKAESHYLALKQSATKNLGSGPAEEILRSFRSSIRIGDFEKAGKSIGRLTESKKKFVLDKKGQEKSMGAIKTAGETYISTIQGAEEYLANAEGKFYMTEAEVNVALTAQEKELEQKEKYIHKYHGPYMNDKRKKLVHLREKLLVFGSLEGLTTMYMKLIRGLSEPLDDIKKVREYESEVIENVNYILKGQFQEIENVERRTKEAIDEFFESIAEFEALTEEK